MKRSSSADRAAPRPQDILPFNNSLPARPTLARSASLGRDVRCGCQFFGTDSLLPEKQALMMLGRPKARSTMSSPKLARSSRMLMNSDTSAVKRRAILNSARSFSSVGDHEYEPVSLPPPTVRVTGPYDRYEPELGNAPREGSNSSTESRDRKERKFLRKPLDDELVGLPIDGEGSEDEAMGVEEKEEMMEDRAIAAPSPGTTTGSRTDLELNTSQVDSSALEDLPLSREGRRQQRLKQMEERGPGAASRSLQRIRSQAGKLRTKLRNIKRPNINMPERPRFSMPERPKFNLPERPKFNFPERPKFNLPERPKFNLPERPKFNFPDRPKFNLPQRPKFNLPERPKFNFPSFSMPRSGLRRPPLREPNDDGEVSVHMDTPAPSTPGKRNYFDFRTYPRLFDRKARNQREMHISAPMQARHITPPNINYDDDEDMDVEDMEDIEDDEPARKPQLPPRRKNSEGTRWSGKFTELDYVDSENVRPPPRTNGAPAPFYDDEDDEEIRALQRELVQASGRRSSDEDHSESLSGFRDKDFGYAVSLGPGKLPHLPPQLPTPAMMMDPDPEDEEIGSFHESEHEAAQSSGSSSDRRRAGVLEEIDSDEFFLREKGLSQEDVDVGRYISSEIRENFRQAPDTKSNSNVILLENATLNEAELARSYRGTPERATAPNNKTRPPRRTRVTRQRSNPAVAPEPVSERYFNTFPPNKPTRNRRRLIRQQERTKKDYSSTMGRPVPPLPPKRKKTTRSEAVLDTTSQWSEDLNNDWLKNVEEQIVPVQAVMQKMETDDHEYIIPEAPLAPAAPKRGRRTSRQTPDDDARSHISHVSHVSHASEQNDPGYARVVRPGVIEIEIVDGPTCTPPPRRVKTLPRPPFPSIRRRRNRPLSGSNQHPHFSTVPHRRGPPTRPSRNYATLGPSRPPRKQRTSSMEDLHDRSLQSGAVIQMMKERPLPAPPRPSRRARGLDSECNSNMGDELQAEIKDLEHDAPIAASEDIDGNVTPTQMMQSSIEKTINDDIKVYEDAPPEEHVIQHVIQLSSALVHTQKELLPEPQKSEIFEPEVTKSEITEHEAPISEASIPEVKEIVHDIKPEVSEVQTSKVVPVAEIQTPTIPEVLPVTEIHTSTVPEVTSNISPQQYVERMQAQILSEVKPDVICPAPEVLETKQVIVCPAPEVPVAQQETKSQIQETLFEISADPISQVHFSEISTQISEPIKEIVTEEISTQASILSSEAAVQSSQDEYFVPVEEVSVSTQTDPLPEDELIGEEIMEPEDIVPPPRKEKIPAPSPPQVQQMEMVQQPIQIQQIQQPIPIQLCPELSPATSALLEALNSGQLRLELLDVARLNVNEVQAQRLLVSDIDGLALNINELQSRAGTLVLNSLDAPMGSLAEALITAAQQLIPQAPPAPQPVIAPVVESTSTGTQMSEPSTPYRESSVPFTESLQSIPVNENIPSSSEQGPSTSSSETVYKISESISPSQQSTLSRSRQSSPYPSSPVFTTEQVVALQAAAMSNAARDSSVPPPLPPRRPSASNMVMFQPEPMRQQQFQEIEPGICELGSRLCRACCTATLSALRRVVTYSERQINTVAEETQERSGLQVALCMVLVLVAGIIIFASLGSGSGPIHHHHWDFYMPQ